MPRLAVLLAKLCLLLVLGPALMAADDLHGQLWLKDASNGDAKVGASMQQGIPQGHALKVAIGGARTGKTASVGTITVVVRDAEREVARASITLDATGYGETSMPIGLAMAPGIYQLHLAQGDGEHETGLGGAFRVIEAAPPMNLPFGAPGMVLVIGAVAFGLVTAWRRQRSA